MIRDCFSLKMIHNRTLNGMGVGVGVGVGMGAVIVVGVVDGFYSET